MAATRQSVSGLRNLLRANFPPRNNELTQTGKPAPQERLISSGIASEWGVLGGGRNLGEELCRKYGLTSLRVGCDSGGLRAIDEALETCAQIADELMATQVADRIRQLKSYRAQSAHNAV